MLSSVPSEIVRPSSEASGESQVVPAKAPLWKTRQLPSSAGSVPVSVIFADSQTDGETFG